MRISDWSSDVCSSDLIELLHEVHAAALDGIGAVRRKDDDALKRPVGERSAERSRDGNPHLLVHLVLVRADEDRHSLTLRLLARLSATVAPTTSNNSQGLPYLATHMEQFGI